MVFLDNINQALMPGQKVIKVDGWQAAKKYPVPRDCEVIMIDSNPDVDYIYMKKVDINGGESFERYMIEADPVPEFDPDKYVTVDDLKKCKEEILNGFTSLKQSIDGSAGSARSSARSGSID